MEAVVERAREEWLDEGTVEEKWRVMRTALVDTAERCWEEPRGASLIVSWSLRIPSGHFSKQGMQAIPSGYPLVIGKSWRSSERLEAEPGWQ